MRRRAVIVGLLALVCGAGPVVAPAQPSAGLRTVNRRRLYTESRFAARVLAMLEARAAAIREENATVTAMLEAEELSLTQRRAESEPAAFRALAAPSTPRWCKSARRSFAVSARWKTGRQPRSGASCAPRNPFCVR
ncbi:MAG: hypothetical protein JKP98_06045 [Rhodobacteraceae bacterium]|nr:hypothetical protein [Paracoccaceae bacterium]